MSELRELITRLVIGAASACLAIGALAALIAWATDHGISAGIAAAYYIIGSILFLLGMFPTGGFSMIRGTLTRRRPMGSRQEPVFLLGLVLIALGAVVDITHPF